MNVFIKKRQNSNSCNSFSPSLSILPNELICRILAFLPTRDLLPIYAIASTTLMNGIITKELMKRLEQNHLGIRLYFDQETRWRYTLDMKLHMVRTHNHGTISPPPPRLHFVPTMKQQNHVFYTSKLLRRPHLYKIILVTTHNSSKDDRQNNLLQKPYAMNIKQSGRPYTAEMHTANCLLTYNVSETPTHVTKTRPGERWIYPLGFQCDLAWLCSQQPPSTITTTIFNNKWFSISAKTPTWLRKVVMGLTTKCSSSASGHHHQPGTKATASGSHYLFHGVKF